MPQAENLTPVRYCFYFLEPNNQEDPTGAITAAAVHTFTIFLEKGSLDLVQPVREGIPLPDWTKLSSSKCRSCPLSEKSYDDCPAARALVDVIEFFSDLPSFEKVKVEVETEERTYSKETTVQVGLRSLMGLILPTSGCPIFRKMRPMAFTHLPFSNRDETCYRAVSMYFVSQYFEERAGGDTTFDLSGLQNLYQELHEVNVDFMGRLRKASTNDANLNSLVSLDVFTMSVPTSIKKELDHFLPLFVPPSEDDPGCPGP